MSRQEKKSYELSEAEQRDLVMLIQQGKSLPEKYRFILFEDKSEVELVWNGKTRDVCNTILPFQSLEHIDEPRTETKKQEDLFDSRGRQLRGWTNKLIWGDNKLILSSLKAGPLRQQIEDAGGLKLIYIDPPFDVGADFSMDIEIGSETFHKEASLLEQIAYRDTWGRGTDSFNAMIYERLVLMRDLMAENGSIFVHCDWRLNGHMRLILDEVFGRERFINEIIWFYPDSPGRPYDRFVPKHDNITRYSKTEKYIFEADDVRVPILEASKERYKTARYLVNSQGKRFEYTGGEASETGKIPETVWQMAVVKGNSAEKVGYPTQKPEALLERIIRSSTKPGDLIADFFVGSGTTVAVAEKLGRKWIATDLGKFGIHTTRKRMIGVQRQLKLQEKEFRAFEVLNLGRYEREAYLNIGGRLSTQQKKLALMQKEKEFRELILRAYKAIGLGGSESTQAQDGFFHGTRNGRLVVIGPINLPVGRLFIEEIITECRKRSATRVDVLAFEFEMGLFPAVLEEARSKGIDLSPKYIPTDVFDKRAIDKGQVVFHDISFVEATPRYNKVSKLSVSIELTDFSVYYTQGAAKIAIDGLTENKSQVLCENGQLYKISKNKDGVINKERLTKSWTDWVDYWAVDFDYMSRKEIIKVPRSMGVEGTLPGMDPVQSEIIDYEERWSGGYIFENEWQSFRTRQSRSLELTTAEHHYAQPGRYTVAVKVIDIFGNDTMTLVPVSIG